MGWSFLGERERQQAYTSAAKYKACNLRLALWPRLRLRGRGAGVTSTVTTIGNVKRFVYHVDLEACLVG